MAARKKAEPKPEPVEETKVQVSESEEGDPEEDAPQADSKDQSVVESESAVTHEDGGLAALQARFDDASRKGYFGPDKEL